LNEATKFSEFKLELNQRPLSVIQVDGPELLEYIRAEMYTFCFSQLRSRSATYD